MKNVIRWLLCLILIFTCIGLVSCDQLPNADVQSCEHDLTEHEAKAPTCTEIGWDAYSTCSLCDYTTYSMLAPLGHEYSDEYVSDGDVHTVSCVACSSVLHEPHSWVSGNRTAPGCDTAGSQAYTCYVCGAEKTEVISALGHSFSNAYKNNGDVHSLFCSRCAYALNEAHDWRASGSVSATCTTEGSKTYKCTDCNATKVETVAVLGHSYSDTYTPDGDVHSLACTRCSDTTAEHPHDWESTGFVTAPTCTKAGTESLKCSVCGAESEQKASALGHSFGDTYAANGDVHSLVCTRCYTTTADNPHDWRVSEITEQPSCTEAGVTKLVCSVCGATGTGSVAPFGHSYGDSYVENGDVHSLSCVRCSSTTADNPHDWQVASITKDPTCTELGESELVCSVCDAKSTGTVAPLGHDFSETPEESGEWQTLTCSRCTETTFAHPHDWQSAGVIKAADCTEDGREKVKCSVCSAEKEVTIPALGHDYATEYAPDGDVHSLSCSRCTDSIGAHPHSWQMSEIIDEPTCSELGTAKYECTVCGYTKTEYLPMAEHQAGAWIITQHPTALESGSRTLKCAVCECDWYSVKIPADVEYMPIVYFTGEYEKATAKKNEVEMQISYVDPTGENNFDAYATIKVQGASSAGYAKKNYTVKFYKDSEYDKKLKIDFGWGKESKYVLKANWVDFSQARNVVSCRLWGDLVQSRNVSYNQQKLAALSTNGGAIDGFPVAVFMNGVYHGLYTLNVPKDDWMFGMGDSETEALIAADDWVSTNFSTTLDGFIVDSNGDLTSNNKGWELRYYGTEDTTGSHAWVTESFNKLILFCQNNQGASFKAGISQYLDVDAAIDYLIFMYANCMHDNASKNMLWATYDGQTWIPTVYDQDGCFGQVWDGVRFSGANSSLPTIKNGKIDVNINYGPPAPTDPNAPRFILWDRLWNTYTEEILDRYYELRATTLSTANIIAELQAFGDCIPESLYEAEVERWGVERAAWWDASSYTADGSTWNYESYHYEYMYEWVEDRMAYYDTAIRNIANYYGYY